VSTLPTVAIGFLAKIFLPSALDGILLPLGFALTFVLLFTSQFAKKQKHNLLTTSYKTGFLCGVVQGIAVLPGLSRSGATICFLKHRGTKNNHATELSFLMSIPVILGAGLVEGYGAITQGVTIEILPLIFGVISAMVSGYIAIKLMLAIIKKANYKWFSLYLVILSLTLAILKLCKVF
jgi:undecaprenyl-diphosphatase